MTTPGGLPLVTPDGRDIDETWRDAGQLFSLFCSDPRYGTRPGAELLGMILPALTLGQFAIARRPVQVGAAGPSLQMPRAGILWASVTDPVHERLRTATRAPLLRADEWAGGAHHWIVHAPGDQTAVGPLIDALRRDRLGNAPLNALMVGPKGRVKVRVLG